MIYLLLVNYQGVLIGVYLGLQLCLCRIQIFVLNFLHIVTILPSSLVNLIIP